MPTIGLLGCGTWGHNILRELAAAGCAVTVVDPSPAARARAKASGAASCARFDELGPVTGLVVATPARTHPAVLRQALTRPVPILCEKPFTTDPARARALAAEGEGRLFVGHVWRYHPGVEALAAIARSGELGPVERVRSTRTNWTSPRTDVDSIWTLAPHDLSIGLELLGALPPPRSALLERNAGQPVGLLAVLGDGPELVIETSTRDPARRRELRLACRDGAARLHPDGGIELLRGLEGQRERRPTPGASPLERELAAFLGFVAGGPPPKSPASEAAQVVETLCALRALAGLAGDP